MYKKEVPNDAHEEDHNEVNFYRMWRCHEHPSRFVAINRIY
jgi:hypothetical protein